ncbi:MAG TPA: flagellar FlbD family protein [Clostridiaceae bacterium]|jgi:flagellar protein FlbD|nr:flagellar FlbD family protein [Clostridiaceae bacterium]
MIKVTRINNTVLYVNPDLIEFFEETPDTVITMTTGKKLMVLESVDELQERIIAYRKEVYAGLPKKVTR